MQTTATWRLYTLEKFGPPWVTVADVSNTSSVVFSARGRGGIYLLLSEDADEMPFKVLMCFPNGIELYNTIQYYFSYNTIGQNLTEALAIAISKFQIVLDRQLNCRGKVKG
jgi:hypothetical protein